MVDNYDFLILTRATWEHRLWEKVETRSKDECWIWLGSKRGTGPYGAFRVGGRKGKVYGAHRLSYILNKGPLPLGCVIMHKCDNTLCVNPNHLKAGTQKENMLDMASKQRGSRRFTKQVAEKIRSEYRKNDTTQRLMAKKYKCSQATIGEICRGRFYNV